jgi:hypothetical protein
VIFDFSVRVELERNRGRFVSRDELADQILGALEDADPSQIDAGEDSEYEVTLWEVVRDERSKRSKS